MKHEMATATEWPGNGRNRVRDSQIKDGQPHRYTRSCFQGMVPGSVFPVFLRRITHDE